MSEREDKSQSMRDQQEVLLFSELQGLIPADHALQLDLGIRTMILLSPRSADETEKVPQFKFTPNALRILVPLLQAYPDYCPYEVLLSCLHRLPLERCYELLQEGWEMAVRPVRRAAASLTAGLRIFGIQVCCLVGKGYTLKPL